MKMKKIFWTVIIAAMAFACNNEDFNAAERKYVGIKTNGLPLSIAEDSDAGVTIPVAFGGDFVNPSAITVNYKVDGGTFGKDYTIVGGTGATGTLTVAAGDTWTKAVGQLIIKGVPDFDTEPSVPLTLTLTGTSDGSQVGYPLGVSYAFTIADDDCDYVFENLTGTASSTEVYTDGDPYGPYDTEFTVVDDNHIIMDNFWDSAMAIELLYHPETRTVEVVDRSWTQYGYDWQISGTGTMNTCSNSVTITVHLTSVAYDYDNTFEVQYKFPTEEE